MILSKKDYGKNNEYQAQYNVRTQCEHQKNKALQNKNKINANNTTKEKLLLKRGK